MLGKKGVRGLEAGAGHLGATKLGAGGMRAWGLGDERPHSPKVGRLPPPLP